MLDSPEEDEGCDEEGDGNEVEGYEAGQQPRLQRMEEPPEAEQNGAHGGVVLAELQRGDGQPGGQGLCVPRVQSVQSPEQRDRGRHLRNTGGHWVK